MVLLNVLLIYGMQLIIVPLTTVRTTLMVKGQRKIASMVALVESMIYVIALGIIFSDLSNYMNMVAYATGYATGIFLGGVLEEKLAIGYRLITVSLLDRDEVLLSVLRDKGFGVTLFEGEGRNGTSRIRLDIVAKRTREKEVMDIVEQLAPKSFVVAYEPTSFKGGYMLSSMKKFKTKL